MRKTETNFIKIKKRIRTRQKEGERHTYAERIKGDGRSGL